jgi:hypothetical protein
VGDHRVETAAIERDRSLDAVQELRRLVGDASGALAPHLLAEVEDVEAWHLRLDHLDHDEVAGRVVSAETVRLGLLRQVDLGAGHLDLLEALVPVDAVRVGGPEDRRLLFPDDEEAVAELVRVDAERVEEALDVGSLGLRAIGTAMAKHRLDHLKVVGHFSSC